MPRALPFLLMMGCCIIISATPLWAAESIVKCRPATADGPGHETMIAPTSAMAHSDAATYGGTLRLFVVEPVSRWWDAEGKNYDFGFLSFAAEEPFSIPYGEKIDFQTTWDGKTFGFGDVTEDNIMVIAVIYNDDPVTAYSDPPSGSPFSAYYVDAAAAALPGETGYNQTTPNSTHTIFIEEGSGTY
ncbi:MAG: hypothetical protein GYA46_10540 [candidate division Zixibacteria bacterium]|nr:hypothetical protein [candidate division Zixibacteria bacterium]